VIDLAPLWITLRLAGTTALILLVLATPLAWWLARSRNRFSTFIEAVVALPLVLPPTVLGYYLLVALAPQGVLGSGWHWLTGGRLAFTFMGLVIGSVVYSLPFAVQPLQTAFEGVGSGPLQAAATLRAGPLDRFIHVVLPLARRGFLSALVLSFAHTVGEFGVVLMIGGNIPGVTQVLSVAIYDHVEALDYHTANVYSIGLLAFAFAVMWLLYTLNRRHARWQP
jgi:molybdate transport system permease protein